MDRGWQAGVLKLLKNDHFKVFFSYLNPNPQFFVKVKEKFLLKLHEMIRMSHVIECPIVFIFLCNLG